MRPFAPDADVATVAVPVETSPWLFADLDPPQTFVLRADEILGNERQTVWRSDSACNSISRADHAAGLCDPAGLRDPTPTWTDPRLARRNTPPNRTHAPSSLQNIRLSSAAANPLSGSQY
jgi:hypothetical protein